MKNKKIKKGMSAKVHHPYLPTFPDGGRIPIITNDPNDPRLKAYQDSLKAFNNDKMWESWIKNLPNNKLSSKELENQYQKIRNKKDFGYRLAFKDKKGYNVEDLHREIKTSDGNSEEFYSDIFIKPVQPYQYQPHIESNLKTNLPEQTVPKVWNNNGERSQLDSQYPNITNIYQNDKPMYRQNKRGERIPYNSPISSAFQYAYGGPVQGNAEVEGDETMRDPNGMTANFEGPSHKNGGIPVNLIPGTEIFSDRLKPEGSNKTFADLSKKYNTTKYQKVIDNKDTDKLKKKSAELMFKRNNSKLDELFNAQESMKQEKLNKSINKAFMKYGGVMKNCYPFGGIINQSATGLAKMFGANDKTAQIIGSGVATATGLIPGMQDNFLQAGDLVGDIANTTDNQDFKNIGELTSMGSSIANMFSKGGKVKYNEGGPVGYNDYMDYAMHGPGSEGYKSKRNSFLPNIGKSKIPGYANTAMEYAPMAFNLFQGLQKPEQLNSADYSNTSNIPYRDLDMTPINNAINSERNLAAKQSRIGSTGNYLSGLQNLSANTMAAKSKALMESQQYNNQNRFAVDQFNNQLRNQNLSNKFNVDQYNAKSRAKPSEYFGAAAEGLQKRALYNKQAEQDKTRLGLLEDFYKNYEYNDGWKLKNQ